MDLLFHIENKKTGQSRDLRAHDAEDWLIKQHTQNDPAMSFARAQELARQMMREAEAVDEGEINLYSITVETHAFLLDKQGKPLTGVLSDGSIHALIAAGQLEIEPYCLERVQPSSYDVSLDNEFRIFDSHAFTCIDPAAAMEGLTKLKRVPAKEQGTSGAPIPNYLVLHPGEFVLGQTAERIHLPDNIVARIEGKSSLGRIGLLVHATAGFVDPGFEGRLTLELSNQATCPILLRPGMLIGQLSFQWLDQPAQKPYNGKYQGDESPTASRSHQDFEEES